VRLSDAADSKFVEVMSAAKQSKDWLLPHIKTAAGQHGISGADLKRLPIPLPSIPEQQIIARRIDTAFRWIDRLASEATSARKLIDHFDQSILAKAFRGELVPQDPNEEPASVLLERIRAERECQVATKRSKWAGK
jgi:type I restriction enzyme S subunit